MHSANPVYMLLGGPAPMENVHILRQTWQPMINEPRILFITLQSWIIHVDLYTSTTVTHIIPLKKARRNRQ
jgi:hypothetical protein